jgi:hypothetical protein
MSEIDNSGYFLQLDQPTKRNCDYQRTATETIEKLTEILKRLRNEDQ